MASLAQPLPKSRKPVTVRERWRTKTNYKPPRFTGYAPIAFAMVAEIGRLTTGKMTQLLYVILTASLGQFTDPKKNEPFKESAADLKTSDLAILCNCDDKTIQRDLGDLARRKVILWEQSKKGVNVITPLFRSWDKLADYKPAPVLEPDAGEEPEPEDPEQNGKAKETTVLTKTPVYVKAGKTSKRFPVSCGVAAFETEVRGTLDAELSAVVQDGVLRVIVEAKWDGKTLNNDLKKQKEIEEKPRQGCRISPNPAESKERKGERGSKGEQRRAGALPAKPAKQKSLDHPRAAELAAIFDPLIFGHCKQTLSGDPRFHLQACEAIGDTPHDDIVKAAVDRGARMLRPSHIPSLCQQIRHDWEVGKSMPAKKAKNTKAPLADPSKVGNWDPMWWQKEKAKAK